MNNCLTKAFIQSTAIGQFGQCITVCLMADCLMYAGIDDVDGCLVGQKDEQADF